MSRLDELLKTVTELESEEATPKWYIELQIFTDIAISLAVIADTLKEWKQ